jgi:hypothetical protein
MMTTEFKISGAVKAGRCSYIIIAPLCSTGIGWWAEGKQAFALNQILQHITIDTGYQICECEEGLYESTMEPEELVDFLHRAGFIDDAELNVLDFKDRLEDIRST